MSRFSYGVTPKLAAQVRKAGGAEEWFERQLALGRRKDRTVKKYKKWFPSLSLSPAELWARQVQEIEPGGDVMRNYQRWVLLRRIHSRNQVAEVMAEFWENHFNVPTAGDAHFTHRVDYGETLRKHALGSFEELLRAAVLHPSMLIYLNATESTKAHPNENLGRELLELHTVGVENYDEDDVIDSARILTGWSVDMFKSWQPVYHKDDHATGKVRVKGFKSKNKKANGKAVTAQYLRHLAHHPDTAERISRKLAVKFVGDEPPKSLVRHLARVYLQNDTQIPPVLRALVASRQFKRSVGDKVRDPGEDVVATYRALKAKVAAPNGSTDTSLAATALIYQASTIGVMPFYWSSPDGQPIDSDSWSTPGRLLGSMRVHFSMAARLWPSAGIAYKSDASWLPAAEVSLAELVDHLAQQLQHRHASPLLVSACCTVTGLPPSEPVSATHDQFSWIMPRLLATVLDTPEFMSR